MAPPTSEISPALNDTPILRPVRREVRTASSTNSIWQAPVDERTFRQAAVDLALATGECPWEADIGLPSLPGQPELVEFAAVPPLRRLSDERYHLNEEIESRLANDFAFVAATKEAVFNVTAACIEENTDANSGLTGLTLRLAANEGISEGLTDGLLQIWACLASPMVEGRSRTEKVFLKIVYLNRLRILQRVRKAVGHPPIFREKGRSRTNPDDRLFRAFTRMQKTKLTDVGRRFVERGFEVNIALLTLLEIVSVEEAESPTEKVLQQLGNISVQCFKATTDYGRIPFKHLLVESGLDARLWLKSKYVGEVDKIGAYWRIAKSFVQTYTRISQAVAANSGGLKLRIEGVQPYNSVIHVLSIQGRPMSCYVHAEIQMLTHYLLAESNDDSRPSNPEDLQSPPPRSIGASKSACFLCYLCLSCNGYVKPPATHGRLYDQWTIPDLAEYTADQARHLRQTISLMHGAMTKLRAEYRLKRPRDHPMTSRVDIDRLSLFSDASGITASQTVPGDNSKEAESPPTQPGSKTHGLIDSVTRPSRRCDCSDPAEYSGGHQYREKLESQDGVEVRTLACGLCHVATFLKRCWRKRSRVYQPENQSTQSTS